MGAVEPSPRRPLVLGIGRVCFDHYLRVAAPSARFDHSKKVGAVQQHLSFGGSVPRALLAAQATGLVDVHFVGWCAEGDRAELHRMLSESGLSHSLLPAAQTGRSFIEYPEDALSFARLVSVEEVLKEDSLDGLSEALPVRHVSDVLTDARHPAALAAARLESTQASTVWVDPGSSGMNNYHRREKLRTAILQADCVLGDPSILTAANEWGWAGRFITSAGMNGSVIATGPFGTVEVQPEPLVGQAVASLGAGDIFRGRVLGHMAGRAVKDFTTAQMEALLEWSLAASAWRMKRHNDLVPQAPTVSEVPVSENLPVFASERGERE